MHLDLPWTPARLEQRVGRVARLGAARDVVHVYAMAPPAAAERVLAVEARLRAKLAVAARSVGVTGAIVPPIGWHDPMLGAPTPQDDSPPRLAESTRARLARWLEVAAEVVDPDAAGNAPVVAAVRAPEAGALALVRDDGHVRLLALGLHETSVDPASVVRVVCLVDEGVPTVAPAATVRAALRRLHAWARARRAERAAAVEEIGAAMLRRRAASAAARVVASVPRHERARAARDAGRLLHVAVSARGAGAERAVEAILDAAARSDGAGRVPTVAGEARGPDDRVEDRPAPFTVLALVLLVCDGPREGP